MGATRVENSTANTLRRRRRRGLSRSLLVVGVLWLLAVIPRTHDLSIFAVPQYWAYDTAFEHRASLPTSDVVIVGVDELSQKHLGRFPWPRRVYGKLLDQLREARAVGIDLLLDTPDTRDPKSDADFAAAIRRQGHVVLAVHVPRSVQAGRASRQLVSVGSGSALDDLDLWCPPGGELGHPLPEFERAAAGVGSVQLIADPDGTFRHAQALIADRSGRIYYHFSVELARVALGKKERDLSAMLPSRTITLGPAIHFDNRGDVLINYVGPTGKIPTYSFYKVLHGNPPPSFFAGKVVVIGATAPGLFDLRPAPFSTGAHTYLGVETNASLTRMFLDGPGLTDSSRSFLWLLLGGLLAALSVLAVWLPNQGLWGIPVGIGVVATETVVFFSAFYGGNAVLPWGPVFTVTIVGWAWASYTRLRLDRSILREQFGVYVSPGVLARLTRRREVLQSGERREVTILFADIRGSTPIAERAAPEQWTAQLNEYLTAMSDAILTFDGYLDKFMGDGIMAVWNVFGDQASHRDLAMSAAVAMLQQLEYLNDTWAGREDRTPLRIGLGLHSGPAIVGNVGSDRRTQFTVIGDAVNTAARVEAMTKELGVSLLLSEATASGLTHPFSISVVGDSFSLRGREEQVRLYGLSSSEPGTE